MKRQDLMSAFELQPFRTRVRADGHVLAMGPAGDFAVLSADELEKLHRAPESLPVPKLAELMSKFILTRPGAPGIRRLLQSRQRTRNATVDHGPTLHILVPTLHCGHSCQYCQVSRSIGSAGVSLTESQIDQSCRTILESPSAHLTVEFQGGDPLLRFDLIERAMTELAVGAAERGKSVTFVVASTLHQLTPEMCDVMSAYPVQLSTSIDGPADLHNRNRPVPTRDAHARTLLGIQLARERLGHASVAALATITRAAVGRAEEVVDEYVRLGLNEISLRPVSPYGFASPGRREHGLSQGEYVAFYGQALARVIYWNQTGYDLREGQAAIYLNKLLSPVDAGYVDLQSTPSGGRAVLVYNYDGFVYASDEARMLAETGNRSMRLGAIGESQAQLLAAPVVVEMAKAGTSAIVHECSQCAFGAFCGPDLTEAVARHGRMDVPPSLTVHCERSQWMFDHLLDRYIDADAWTKRLFTRWAQPRRAA